MDNDFDIRGRGMVWGLDVHSGEFASKVTAECFDQGLVIESAGANGDVIKLLPSLTIDSDTLRKGLKILADAVATCSTNTASAVCNPVLLSDTDPLFNTFQGVAAE